MFARKCVLSLLLPFFAGIGGAIDLDVNSQDSVKSVAKTLAGAIVAAYHGQDAGQVPGIFDDPYSWWEGGAVWGALVEYSYLTGDTEYNDLVSQALQFQASPDLDYMPENQTKVMGNDDQTIWALAALTAAEVGFPKPQKGEWVDLAKNVFDDQVRRWDDQTCGGGLRWQIFTFNNGYDYKNSYTAANFFLLSARLAQLTGNATYLQWAEKGFIWAQDVGFVSDDFHVYDGADTTTDCKSINKIQWTYPHSIFTEGVAVMYNITKGNNTWKNVVNGFVSSSSIFQDNNTSILSDVACETIGKCNVDQKAFKGFASSAYARAAVSAPFAADSLLKVLQASAAGAAKQCDSKDKSVTCGTKWYEKNTDAESANNGGLSEAFSALEVVQALLYQQAGTGSNSTTPASKTSGTGTSPSATGSAAGGQGTGSAVRAEIAWGTVGFAALCAMFG